MRFLLAGESGHHLPEAGSQRGRQRRDTAAPRGRSRLGDRIEKGPRDAGELAAFVAVLQRRPG
jgi:hypothetical protein